MIYYPINPKTNTFDATDVAEQYLRMTFQGDILTYEHFKIFDYDTGEVVWDALYGKNDLSPIAYNGEQVTLAFGGSYPCSNGHQYVWQVSMTQKTVDGSNFINDIPTLGGKIRKASSGTTVYIADNLTSIYPWGKSSNVYSRTLDTGDTPTNNMSIKIGDEERNIVSYETGVTVDNETYGVITVDSAFTNAITTNDKYYIYSSFVISPQYFFRCSAKPVVNLSYSCLSNRVYCSGSYSQTENIPIKNYRLKLYWSNNPYFLQQGDDVDVEEREADDLRQLVSDSGKVYSQSISYEFWHPYRHDYQYPPLYDTEKDYYKIVCEIVTQDDSEYSYELIFEKEPITIEEISPYSTVQTALKLWDFKLEWDETLGGVVYKLTGYGANASQVYGDYMIFRTDIISGETVPLQFSYIRREDEYFKTLVGYDITAPTHGKYKYSVALFTTDGRLIITEKVSDSSPYTGLGTLPNRAIEPNDYAYYMIDLDYKPDSDLIYHPTSHDDEKPNFEPNNIWKFIGEIQDTTVTNNLDRITHVGYSQYISSTSTDVNYMSGTLSALMGYVNCTTHKYTDTIALVRAWRRFVTQQKPFILKSQKGDVWVVNVTDNPSTQYDESNPALLTTFTVSWAECYNINDITMWGKPVPPLDD